MSDAGTPETSDQGEWFNLQDGPPPVEARVRDLPDHKSRAIERKHGRETHSREQLTGTSRPTIEYPDRTAASAAIFEKACFAWTDCRNLVIRIVDASAAEFYSKHLGEVVTAGQDVRLDGRLNDAIKLRLFAKQEGLAVVLLRLSAQLKADLKAAQNAKRGNS